MVASFIDKIFFTNFWVAQLQANTALAVHIHWKAMGCHILWSSSLLSVTFVWDALDSCRYLSVFGQQSKSTLGKKILFQLFLKEKAKPQIASFSVTTKTNFAF